MGARDQSNVPDPLDGIARTPERAAIAAKARATRSPSPATMSLARANLAPHIVPPPRKQCQFGAKAAREYMHVFDCVGRRAVASEAAPDNNPLAQDHRFSDPAWKRPSSDLIAQPFLFNQQIACIGGASRHFEGIVHFAMRQVRDMVVPTNFFATNPGLRRRMVRPGVRCPVESRQHRAQGLRRTLRGGSTIGAFDRGYAPLTLTPDTSLMER
ncbi:hypothetical protein [Tardiphaga sp.]|uniref:hypothetical protein n=1 Tax=Tardiphaga sp. TaxID=1926292 RepID=UPI00352A209F